MAGALIVRWRRLVTGIGGQRRWFEFAHLAFELVQFGAQFGDQSTLAGHLIAQRLDRQLLVGMMTPLYFARVASFVNTTRDMSNVEAEAVVQQQALIFEEMKGYLVERWDEEEARRLAAASDPDETVH